MGADYYPTTLIGVRIPMEKIVKIEKYERLKTFEEMGHKHRGKTFDGKDTDKCPNLILRKEMRCCPYCGCGLYTTQTDIHQLVPGLHLDTRDCGHQKYKEWVMAYDSNMNYLFIGFYALEGDQEGDCAYIGLKHELDTKEIENKKVLLKSDLKEVGLWNEEEFGLWLFMFNSY